MSFSDHLSYVEHCVRHLSLTLGARPAGSPANRSAAEFIARQLQDAGYESRGRNTRARTGRRPARC
ncbi:MAG: hypothetical protein AB1497_06705 [Bacillota bacterium]